jgi:hypothetical protein
MDALRNAMVSEPFDSRRAFDQVTNLLEYYQTGMEKLENIPLFEIKRETPQEREAFLDLYSRRQDLSLAANIHFIELAIEHFKENYGDYLFGDIASLPDILKKNSPPKIVNKYDEEFQNIKFFGIALSDLGVFERALKNDEEEIDGAGTEFVYLSDLVNPDKDFRVERIRKSLSYIDGDGENSCTERFDKLLEGVRERGNPRKDTAWHQVFALSNGSRYQVISLDCANLHLLDEKGFDSNNQHHRKQLAYLASDSLTNTYNRDQEAVEAHIEKAGLNDDAREIITKVVRQHYAPKRG